MQGATNIVEDDRRICPPLLAWLRLVDADLKLLLIALPRLFIDAIAARATRAMSRPYSTKSCPSSLHRTFSSFLIIHLPK